MGHVDAFMDLQPHETAHHCLLKSAFQKIIYAKHRWERAITNFCLYIKDSKRFSSFQHRKGLQTKVYALRNNNTYNELIPAL